jgi:hypothetical protein
VVREFMASGMGITPRQMFRIYNVSASLAVALFTANYLKGVLAVLTQFSH